jgi:hypothetical protein
MTDKYIRIYFAYRGGEPAELKQQHRNAFEHHGGFEMSSPFIETSFGTVEILSNDIPNITGMSHLENYEYEGEDKWDLLYSPLIKYSLDEDRYLEGGDDNPFGAEEGEPLQQFVELVATGYEATDERPIAVYAETPRHAFDIHQTGDPPFTAESLANDEYEQLSWLTVFTPPMVETYGRETLLSAPAWEVRELDDGAIVVLCHDDVDWESDCRDVAEHIGLPAHEDLH